MTSTTTGRWLAERHTAQTLDEPRPGGTATARRERRRQLADERRRAAPLRREIEALEQRLGTLSDERASIESVLADGAVYGEDERARLHELLVRRGKLDAEITTIESTWLEKSEQLDAMRGSWSGASSGMQ